MEDKIYKLAVVGYPGSTSLYQAAGAHVYSINSMEEARKTMEDIALPKKGEEDDIAYAVVLVEDEVYYAFPQDLVERFAKRALPAVIPIPSSGGKGKNRNRLKDLIEKAVGSDILG